MSTIYIHWPFCISKCHYCNFNSVKCPDHIDFEKWLHLYKNVLLRFKQEFYKGEDITSIYFGGGTPSLLPEYFVDELIKEIADNFKLIKDAEITMEANPKTITRQKAIDLNRAGINRLSIGVQSIRNDDLRMLGRIHNAEEARNCVFEMSEIFDNLSIDMIYNRPGQKLQFWEDELNEVLTWPIRHISLYELIVEDNTKLKELIDIGRLQKPKDSAEFFERTIEIAENAGFEMYEVSNFAKEGRYGKHNLSYWRYEDYYGIGPGSHSRVTLNNSKIAIEQISDNMKWLTWAEEPEFVREILTEKEIFEEKCIMGLRSKCGLNVENLPENIKISYDLKNKLEKLMRNLYIIKEGGKIILTREGIKRLNLVIEFLVRERIYENFD